MDSPVSFHGVSTAKADKPAQRKSMIRAHVAVPETFTKFLYGVSLEKFRHDYFMAAKLSFIDIH